MYLNTTLCKGQVDLNWPLRWGLLGTLGCSSVGDDSHENASSLGCCAGGGFGESIWDEGVWWRWGERCVALIQVRKNQGWRYHSSINKLCKRQWTRQMPRVSPTLGNFSWALPMAPWMTWGDAVELYMKQTPTTEASLEEYRKASPAALLRGLRKKKGKHLSTKWYFCWETTFEEAPSNGCRILCAIHPMFFDHSRNMFNVLLWELTFWWFIIIWIPCTLRNLTHQQTSAWIVWSQFRWLQNPPKSSTLEPNINPTSSSN